MTRMRVAWAKAVDELGVLAHLHVAAAIGLAAAIASEVAHTDGIQKAIIGFAVTVVVSQVADVADRGGRASCLEHAAVNARAILNRGISVSLTQDFDHGPHKVLVLRELAGARDGGDLAARVWGYAGFEAIAKHVADSRSGLLTELGTCYPKLRAKAQRQVDAFTGALSELTVYALAVAWNTEPDEPTRYDQLLAKLRDAVRIGDDLDDLGDPRGALAARQQRQQAAAAANAKQRAAADVLVANARDAIAPLDAATPANLLSELRGAVDRTRRVDGSAIQDAPEKVRLAHRAVTESLAHAIELGQDLERDPSDERARALGDALTQITTELTALGRVPIDS